MKTLFIHIGNLKTGTSSIQYILDKNSDLLRQHGIHYFSNFRAKNNPTNHSLLALELLTKFSGYTKPFWYDESYNLDVLIDDLIVEINSSECQQFILSSEEFSRASADHASVLNSFRSSLKNRCGEINIVCFFYVRAPFDFYKSWYTQINKELFPSADRTENFLEYFMSLPCDFLSQHPTLELFKNNLADQLQCCLYSPGSDSFSLFVELLARFDCHLPSSLSSFSERMNDVDLTRQNIELLRLVHRDKSFDEVTLSSSFSIPEALSKIDAINQSFVRFQSDNLLINPPSYNIEFSFSDLLSYYIFLLGLTEEFFLLNEKEIDLLRDRAIGAKEQFPEEALQCLLLISKLRPDCKYILSQINELRDMWKGLIRLN